MTVSSQSITVTATPGAEPSSAERWLRLTTDPPDREEGVSKAQLAGMLDSLIGITDHCKKDSVPAENIDDIIKEKLGGQAECQAAAEQLDTAEKCSPARRTGQPVKKNVYAHWSWHEDPPSELYRVTPLGSAIVLSGPSRGSKVINLVIDVTNSNSAPVRYHADEEARIALWRKQPPRWIGNVVVGKRIVAGPSIGWSNGKVLLGATVSGRLELWLPIIYDTWTISIPGVWMGDGKRSYRAKVLGSSELLAQPAELHLEDETEGDPDADDCSACGGSSDAVPDDQLPGGGDDGDDGDDGGEVTGTVNGNPIYCYLRIDWTLYKSCTGDQVDSGTEYLQVQCPKDEDITPTYNHGYGRIPELPDYIYEVGREEVERYTGGGEEITAAEYKDKCCYDAVYPSWIPQCMTSKSIWYGTTWPRIEKKLKEQYAGETKIVYVGPMSGVCGTRTDDFVADGDCCTDVVEITYDEYMSPDVISEGGDATVYWTGGKSPYQIKLTGTGFFLSDTEDIQEAEVGGHAVKIFARGSCGACTIDISDNCDNKESGILRSSNGMWVTVLDTMQDSSDTWAGPCIIGDVRWWDDYCISSENTCTGIGEFHCEKPLSFPEEWDSCEGNIKQEWRCQ